jgi:hypothetical protein
MLLITFAFGAANGGPTPDQIIPTAIVGVQSIGLEKAPPNSPPALVVDAGEVNPTPGKAKSKAKKG